MEEKKKNLVIAILLVVIVLLVAFIVLVVTGTISFKSDEVINNVISQGEEENNNVENNGNSDNEQESTDKVLTETEVESIIKSVMKKSYAYINALSPECGEKNQNDIIQENNQIYVASANYNTLNELRTYLHTFLSDNIIDSVEEKYVVAMYKEKDNKLYCLQSSKGCGVVYNDAETNYTIGSITNNEIKAGGNIYYETCGNVKKAEPVSFTLKRNNDNNWILDTYLTK